MHLSGESLDLVIPTYFATKLPRLEGEVNESSWSV